MADDLTIVLALSRADWLTVQRVLMSEYARTSDALLLEVFGAIGRAKDHDAVVVPRDCHACLRRREVKQQLYVRNKAARSS